MADNVTTNNDGLNFDVQSEGLNRLIIRLNGISQQLENIYQTINKFNNATIKQSKVINETSNAFDKSTKKAKNWGKSISKSLLSFISIRTLAPLLGKLVTRAGSWVENLNLFQVTFNDQAEEMLDWALEFSNKLGVANNEIIKMSGLFKQVSDSIGITDDTSDALAKTLTSLTYDKYVA